MSGAVPVLDISALAGVVETRRASRIALQAPEGVSARASRVAHAVERELGVEVLLLGGGNHGPCHYRPPAYLRDLGVPVLAIGTWSRTSGREAEVIVSRSSAAMHAAMVPVEIDGVTVVELGFVAPECDASSILPFVREFDGVVGIVSFAPLLGWIEPVAELLRQHGIRVTIPRGSRHVATAGQIFGCDCAVDSKAIDAYVFIGPKRFHPEGVVWATRKPVVCFDPFTKRTFVISPDEVRARIVERGEVIRRCAAARRFGVIVSPIAGQERLSLARRAAGWITAAGREAQIVVIDEVSPGALSATDYDAYVNTACPRIVTEDGARYETPLLSPWELRVVLGQVAWDPDAYRMDQIRSPFPYALCWRCG